MSDHEIVKKSLIEIFSKNGYVNVDHLTQRDHEFISQAIETRTGILISSSTIKRLLHGEFSRLPQVATLNAIAQYIGHKNWQDYRTSITALEENAPAPVYSETLKPAKPVLSTVRNFKFIALAVVLVGIIIIAGFIQFAERHAIGNIEKASFSAQKNTQNEIPNTVVFHYNVDDVDADSFFIQQSWDDRRRVQVFKNNYTLTDIYYVPGYHIAKLIANDSIIRTVDISIPTDRWFLFAAMSGSTPQYINPVNFIRDGIFSIDEKDLMEKKIDLEKVKEYVYVFYPSKLEVSSDNYVLKTKVRMKEVKGNSCPYIMLEIFCQKYFMFFKSTTKGCASESFVQFGENFLQGRQHDLSSLSFDVFKWTDVEVRVDNKQVTIKFDGQKVFSTTYQNSMDLIAGLGFVSNGLCEVDEVELKGLNGTVVYKNDFSQPVQ